MRTTPKIRKGFTLIELLTVIAIIGILAAILIPVVGAVREKAKQAACVSNIRQIGLSAHLFAAENDDRLPDMEAAGAWAWDVPYRVMADLIQVGGGERDMFYCPSSPPEMKSDGWDFAINNDTQTGHRFISYVLLFNDTAGVPPFRQNVKIGEPNPMQTSGGRNPTFWSPTEAQKELAVDAVLGDEGNWIVTGGAANAHRPNHMDETRPAGGNILFLDAHVEWRPFSEMEIRTTGGENFWW